MANPPDPDTLAKALLVTPLHRAVYELLVDAGCKDGYGDAEGPPIAMASMITMTLSAYPTEDQLVDAMTWGHRESWDEMRPLARRLLALLHSDAPPA